MLNGGPMQGDEREVRSLAIEQVYEAILSGYRTAREVQAGTGLNPVTCRTSLTKLRDRGRLKITGSVIYPTESQPMHFYEPVL